MTRIAPWLLCLSVHFLFGEWPSREFDVMLSMVKHDDPQREKWIQSTNMVVVDEWTLPMDRVGRIYVHPDLAEKYTQSTSE